MENRLIIKKIQFIKQLDIFNQDIKIKLYHNEISQISEIFWDYLNNQVINWKFIFNYDNEKPINFLILDDELFNTDNIIGQVIIEPTSIKDTSYVLDMYEFPDPISLELDIKKESEIIGKIFIDQYIIPEEFSTLFKCGIGWNLPDSHPHLELFPLKRNNEIYQHIKIIDDKFGIDEKNKFDLYSEAFSRIIDEPENKPPLCFGIIGPDNYGKTNFLYNLKQKLIAKEKSKYKNQYNPKKIIIDFNAWSFEADNTIWASILMHIHDALETKIGKNKLKWLRIQKQLFPNKKSTIIFILKLIIFITLLTLLIVFNSDVNTIITACLVTISLVLLIKDFIQLVKCTIGTISDNVLKKITKPDWNNQLGFMSEIKTEFFDFINPVIKDYNLRLILLIDDLDRCSIEKIYIIIKALSLLKNSDCPIYIFIAYDSIKVLSAIKSYYKKKYSIVNYNSKYLLEKLINIQFCLPTKNLIENLTLIDEYLGEEYFLNLRNELIKKVPDEQKMYKYGAIDIDKTLEYYYTVIFPNKELPNKKTLLNEIAVSLTPLSEVSINPHIVSVKGPSIKPITILDDKSSPISIDNIQLVSLKNITTLDEKLLQIEQNLQRNTFTLHQLENYYRYLIKIEKEYINKTRINEIKNMLYIKFIHLKKDYTNNYYIGLDTDEIKIFQEIINDTNNSENTINNYQVKKIINIYSIARFLLPNFLQNKKHTLFHLIVLTEKWPLIIIQLCININKIKYNLSINKIRECFSNKEVLFFYLNNESIEKNDEFILYLTKFDIKVIDFIELEAYIFNLDRCLLSKKTS